MAAYQANGIIIYTVRVQYEFEAEDDDPDTIQFSAEENLSQILDRSGVDIIGAHVLDIEEEYEVLDTERILNDQ